MKLTSETETCDASRRVPLLICLALFALLVSMVVSMPVQLYGDGLEYITMASSMLYSHDLVFEQEDLQNAARRATETTYVPNHEFGMHTNVSGRTGERIYGTHSFYYSVLALPFFALFGARGFLVLNALMFCGVFWLLYRHFARSNGKYGGITLALAILGLSSASTFVFWLHTEVMVLLFGCAAVAAALSFRPIAAGLAAGVLIALKPPAAMLVFPLALWLFAATDPGNPDRSRALGLKQTVLFGAAIALALAPQLLFLWYHFGQLTSPRFHSSLSFLNMRRMVTFWFGPGQGFFWFYPMALWCLMRNQRPWWLLVAMLGGALAASIGTATVDQFYSHEVGFRYHVYILPFFLFLGGTWRNRLGDWACVLLSCLLGGALLLNPVGNMHSMQIYNKTFPSIPLGRVIGLTMYPEAFFNSAARLPRNCAADFIDSEDYLRKERVTLLSRKVSTGQAVAKFIPGAHYLTGTPGQHGLLPDASLSGNRRASSAYARTFLAHRTETVGMTLKGGARVSGELVPGRVTTLALPVSAERLPSFLFQMEDPQEMMVNIAEFYIRAPMTMRLGRGELRWQGRERYFAGEYDFHYLAGPRLLAFYPPGDWILATMASEDLAQVEPAHTIIREYALHSGIIDVTTETEGGVEGSDFLRLTNTPAGQGVPGVVFWQEIRLSDSGAPPEEVEIAAWFRTSHLQASPPNGRVGFCAWFFDEAHKQLGAQADLFGTMQDQDWDYYSVKIDVPPNAVYMRLGALFGEGISGELDIDDLIVSRFQDRWRN